MSVDPPRDDAPICPNLNFARHVCFPRARTPDVDSNTTAYDNQLTAIEDALKTYGTDHVLGVTVGNEYILSESPRNELEDESPCGR